MSATRFWTAAGDDSLKDGEWHGIVEVMAVIARHVPSPVAVRRFATTQSSRHARLSRTIRMVSIDQQIMTGANEIARDSVRAAVRCGRWERSGDMVRLNPSRQRNKT